MAASEFRFTDQVIMECLLNKEISKADVDRFEKHVTFSQVFRAYNRLLSKDASLVSTPEYRRVISHLRELAEVIAINWRTGYQ